METYIYNPLKDANSVRFVRLLPATGGGIHCDIFRASLTAKVNYIALSYAWGCTERTRPITCNGRRLYVTESLLSALQRLRLPTEPRLFWIDALCIDQENIPERNHQVSLVRDIYKRAQQLYVWLGPGEKYSNHRCALDLMKTFAAAQRQARSTEAYLVRHPSSEQWQAFAKLLQRGWFERMWVIQELAMGLKLTGQDATVFLCGSHRFGLEVLKDACRWCLEMVPNLRPDAQDSAAISNILDGAKRVLVLCDLTNNRAPMELKHQQWRQWLLAKVAATRDKKATDPRDRLFALYGFLHDAGAEYVPVADYSKAVNEIFHQFAQEYVIECQSTDIFSEVEEPDLRRMQGVPSWVPDWTILPERIPLLQMTEGLGLWKTTGLGPQPSYRAGGSFISPIHILNEEFIGLLFDGIVVDEIFSISEPLTQERLTMKQECAGSPCFLINLFRSEVSMISHYPTGESAIEAFYKTLIAGREENNQYLDSFIAFWKSLYHSLDSSILYPFYTENSQLFEKGSATHDLPPEATLGGVNPSSPSADRSPKSPPSPHRYMDLLLPTSLSRTFFTTLNHRFMGLGIRGSKKGDLIVVLSGSKTPFIIRPLSTEDLPLGNAAASHSNSSITATSFKIRKAPRSPLSPIRHAAIVGKLVGEAYVHGIMNGEAVAGDGKQWERIGLV